MEIQGLVGFLIGEGFKMSVGFLRSRLSILKIEANFFKVVVILRTRRFMDEVEAIF